MLRCNSEVRRTHSRTFLVLYVTLTPFFSDANNDGMIDLEEFYVLWAKLQQSQAAPPAGASPKGFALPPMM